MFRIRVKPNYLHLLGNTDSLIHNAETYFAQCEKDEIPPTPSGLSMALGFSSFHQLKKIVAKALEKQVRMLQTPRALTSGSNHANGDPIHSTHDSVHDSAHERETEREDLMTTLLFEPPPFLPAIDQAFSHIEDKLLQGALMDELRATTVQYVLGAYFDRQPINKSKQQVESTENKTVRVIIQDSTTSSQAITPEEREEIERLRSAVPLPSPQQKAPEVRDISDTPTSKTIKAMPEDMPGAMTLDDIL